MQYTLAVTDEGSNITVFVEGQKPLVAHSDHPSFEKIRDGVLANDESVLGLFDLAATAGAKFERLSERVTTAAGRLFFDGEEVDNALATQVVRFIKEDVEDWKPLVAFFENVEQNPNQHSREQLYTWLVKEDFTITQDGLIVGYKGVSKNAAGEFVSVHSGTATVNGVVHNGQIPNPKDAIVEMPRSEVQHDPARGCHTGLHVGTHEYAKGYSYNGALLEVHVNPRDVVSVPTDCDWAKVRVCRYTVVDTIEAKRAEAVVLDDEENDEEDVARQDVEEVADPTFDNLDVSEAIAVGDRFEDQDKRRVRVLKVTSVDGDKVKFDVFTNGVQSGKGKMKLKRLLVAYRFKKV